MTDHTSTDRCCACARTYNDDATGYHAPRFWEAFNLGLTCRTCVRRIRQGVLDPANLGAKA